MDDTEFYEKLKDMSTRFKKINSKVKLLSLIESAKIEYDKHQYENCIEKCEAALKENPQSAVAYRGLGCAMQSLGNFEKAKEYYLKALEFSEKKEIEYTLLGTVFYWEDNLDEALRYYNFAIDENEGYDPAYEGKNQTMLEHHLQILDLQEILIKSEQQ